jgi:hypothetical protein
MRMVATIAMIAGTFFGGLSLVLLVGGWLSLVPYTMIAGGRAADGRRHRWRCHPEALSHHHSHPGFSHG